MRRRRRVFALEALKDHARFSRAVVTITPHGEEPVSRETAPNWSSTKAEKRRRRSDGVEFGSGMDDFQIGQFVNRADGFAQLLGCGRNTEKPPVGHLDQCDRLADHHGVYFFTPRRW